MRSTCSTKHKLAVVAIAVMLNSCSTPGPGLFARKSPHEQYGRRISDAGLRETALGRLWFQAADHALATPLSISLPYRETGYFAAERPQSAGLRFNGIQGQNLRITLEKKPLTGFTVYLDLWESLENNTKPKLLASADTSVVLIDYEIKKSGSFILGL